MYDDPYGGYGAYDSGPDPLVILIGLVAITIGLGIAIGIHWMLYRAFAAIPEEHRQLEPWQVWLNLIPCFNLFWSFVVFVRLPRSFRSYFIDRTGDDPTNGFETLGLAYCICTVVSAIPYVGMCFGLVTFVLLIMYLVKAWDLKRMVEAGTMGAPTTF